MRTVRNGIQLIWIGRINYNTRIRRGYGKFIAAKARDCSYLSTSEAKTDDNMLIAIGEIENEILSKKYGLVWEEHEEAVDVKMRTCIPVFTESADRDITADPHLPYNFILEGDNLHSLYLLDKTCRERVDCVYIDPPYNTGAKDWKYNNDYVDKTNTFRHSKWLSMMNARLQIARRLLKDEAF